MAKDSNNGQIRLYKYTASFHVFRSNDFTSLVFQYFSLKFPFLWKEAKFIPYVWTLEEEF